MLNRTPDKLHSEGRGVKMMGGARARRRVGCWFRRVDVPDSQHGEKWWRGVVAGDGTCWQGSLWLLVHGEDDGQFMGALVYSEGSGRCRDGMVRHAGQGIGRSQHVPPVLWLR